MSYRQVVVFVMIIGALGFIGCSEEKEKVEILSFTASDTDVLANDPVTLSWEVDGADRLTISPDVGDVTGMNSTVAYPVQDTTYTLTAENDDDDATATVSVVTSSAGFAYLSNPITATGDGSLRDESDQTTTQLEQCRSQVELAYLDDTGRLVGTYADLSAEGISHSSYMGYDPPADYTLGSVVTTTESYHFTRDTYAFSEVNCYYHITWTHDLLEELGFGSINNRSVPVDAFYFPGLNAFYMGYDRGLHFGYHYFQNSGAYVGPDSTEDSEVVVHELGHSVQDDQTNGWGNGPAQGMMGEGFSDYLGQKGSQDPRFPYFEGEWFAHLSPSYISPEGIPYLRPLNSDRVFPDDAGMTYIDDAVMGTGVYYEVHYDGIIWSSALMELDDTLKAIHGTDSQKALRLILQSHYDNPYTLREAASAIVAANSSLYGDEDDSAINAVLTDRGFFSEPRPPEGYPVSVLAPNSTLTLQTYAPLAHYVTLTIGSGVTELRIMTSVDESNPDADMDIYVRQGSVHYYEFDYAATTPYGEELITISNPTAGDYGICVHAYSKNYGSGSGMVIYYLTAEVS